MNFCTDCFTKFGTIQSRTQDIIERWRGKSNQITAIVAIVQLEKSLPKNLRIILTGMFDCGMLCARLDEIELEMLAKFKHRRNEAVAAMEKPNIKIDTLV